MEVLRAHITGWTASFRYPIFISGFQPTLPVPPMSTIYGFLSALKGATVTPADVVVGYIFESKGKFVDVETVYELEGVLGGKSNICRREVLAEPNMYLYIVDREYENYLKKPYYPILLGRSSDLCMINEVKAIELKKIRDKIRVGKSIIPFGVEGVYGVLQSLPTCLTNDIPRRAEGTRMYYLVDNFMDYSGDDFYYDEEMNWGVYLYGNESSVR